jgi:short-subunit dehydrogenase
MEASSYYTLITGASHGIGKAFCHEFAKRGHNLFLVALPDDRLASTERELNEKYDVRIVSMGMDMTKENAAGSVYNFALSNNIRINHLINNAGIGSGGLFINSNNELNAYIMRLNNQAMVELTHIFLPSLIQQAPSYILNMSSMEATLPLPYKSVYTATKNFIYSFSLALSEELKPLRVKVSVVCPGAVLTNEDGLKRIESMGWRARLLLKMPEDVASIAIKRMNKGKRVIIPGILPLLIIRIMHFLPLSLKMRILEKIFRNYKDHEHVRISDSEDTEANK